MGIATTETEPLDPGLPQARRRPAFPTLKAWRMALGLNQRTAADFLQISQSSFARLESGKPPRPAIGKRISQRTGVSFETIMGVGSE